jgi:metacaspase-1
MSAMRIVHAAAVLAVGGLVFAQPTGPTGPQSPQGPQGPQKLALIVALSKYAPGTGWPSLSSATDVSIIRGALERHGFTRIATLTDEKATKAGILRAIKEDLLDPARPGDVVVFHFSGHGQQITDDEPEEVDGYDETLVPYDAPSAPGPGYTGERHLRDDTLAEQLDLLRRKVGPGGNVVVWLDSCYSGTGVRGTAKVRGGMPPIGPPRPNAPVATGPEDAVSFADGARSRGGGAAAADLAPYVMFSAASSDQLSYETTLPGGGSAGSLSYALGRVLADAGKDTTYLSVYEGLQREMQSVPNHPQREGDVNRLIFGGAAVTQDLFLRVLDVSAAGTGVTLEGGTLGGVLAGSRIEVHAEGTRTPTVTTLLARGTVTSATLTQADVSLEKAADRNRLAKGRAFVTRYALGSLRIRVQAVGLGAPLLQELNDVLRPIGAVELVDSDPEVIVRAKPVSPDYPGGVAVEVASTGLPLMAPQAGDGLARDVAARLQDYARNRYMRNLDLTHPRLSAQLEMVPARVSNCHDPGNPSISSCTVTDLPAETFRTPGGELRVPVASRFTLRVKVSQKAFVAVLDLQPDGAINLLWPLEGNQEAVSADGPHRLDMLYGVNKPLGAEAFLLVATEKFVDFGPFRTLPGVRGLSSEARGNLGAFAPLFDDEGLRTRGATFSIDPTVPTTTARVLFEIVPPVTP